MKYGRRKPRQDAVDPLAVSQALRFASDVLAHAVPAQRETGIYFLIRNNTVVYVGQALHAPTRVDNHRQGGRQFDSWALYRCAPEHLDCLEAMLILALEPSDQGRTRAGDFARPRFPGEPLAYPRRGRSYSHGGNKPFPTTTPPPGVEP